MSMNAFSAVLASLLPASIALQGGAGASGAPPWSAQAPAAQASGAQGATPSQRACVLELSAGPLRAAWERVSATTEPASISDDLGARGRAPGIARTALAEAATWERWHTALVALRAKEAPRERARLALIALEQGRYASAWSHLERTGDAPEVFAALLPRFLPGVEAGVALASGGCTATLPDGARLAPALPPAPAPAKEGEDAGALRAPSRSLRAELQVGAARVSLSVAVENEGVQVEVAHLSGGVAHLSIVLPRPEDQSIATEYVDWFKQDTLGAPLPLELAPETEPHILFGRFEPRAPHWPTRVPETLPAAVQSGGLWLVVPADDAERPLHTALARALSFPELGLACGLRAAGDPGRGGVDVDLSDASLRADKRAWLITSVEALVLRR